MLRLLRHAAYGSNRRIRKPRELVLGPWEPGQPPLSRLLKQLH